MLDVLKDKYFLSFDDNGKLEWQGVVVHQVAPEIWLVQLFDWLTGLESDVILVDLQTMLRWKFYFDIEDMKHDCKYKYKVGS